MGPAHAKNIVDYACRAALSQRGVVHLALPIDYQVADMSQQKRYMRNVKGHTSEAFTAPKRIPERSQMEKAARMLHGKSKVAILVGAGARGAGAEVLQVADRLAAPVVKALLGKDVIPDDNPYTTGGIGVVGTRASSDVFENCEALLIVGSSFPYIEFLPKPGQAVGIQIDDKPERIGLRYPADLGLVGDAQATLRDLLMYLPRNENRAFLQQAQKGMDEWWDLMEERGTRTEKPMKPQVVSWNLSQLLEDDAIIAGDSGTVTTHIARMKLRAQQKFSLSGTHCSMAASLPYAIEAQVAYPGRQVVTLTGDGSLSIMMGDLATLVQHKLPVKIIVLKNNILGLIKWEQMIYLGNPEYGVDLSPIDFVKVAEACGLRAIHIEEPKKCQKQLKEALAMDGPVLVECLTDPLEPPMPTKATKAEMKHFAESLARGERDRARISLTMARQAMDEALFPASDFGILPRLKNAVTGSTKKED